MAETVALWRLVGDVPRSATRRERYANRARVQVARHLNDQHNIVISEREPSTLDLSAKLSAERVDR
jgi:hypothetical protein